MRQRHQIATNHGEPVQCNNIVLKLLEARLWPQLVLMLTAGHQREKHPCPAPNSTGGFAELEGIMQGTESFHTW